MAPTVIPAKIDIASDLVGDTGIEPVRLFHPAYASRVCNTWMALASCPARQGQQRSLRRILHVLSWAFARSPGARSRAWARLASFWDSGLFFPRYGIFAYVLPW